MNKWIVIAAIVVVPWVHGELDRCSKELLLSYFPSNFVENTLMEYNVSEKEWKGIITDLQSEDDQVVVLVEEKAAKMDPNPLKVAGHRDMAVALFRETLYEVFSRVLSRHGITEPSLVAAMLDDIQFQKAKRFVNCMEEAAAE